MGSTMSSPSSSSGGVTARVRNAAEVQRVLKRMRATVLYRARTLGPVLTNARASLSREISAEFRAGGRPAWQERQPNTVAKHGERPLLGGPSGSIRNRTPVTLKMYTEAGALDAHGKITVLTEPIGAMHQIGRVASYPIVPIATRYLCFLVVKRPDLDRVLADQNRQRTSPRRVGLHAFTKAIGPGGKPAPPGTVWLYTPRVVRPFIRQRRFVPWNREWQRILLFEAARDRFRGADAV